ncbi:MAG: zinc-binding dehydrogenase [Rhizobiaceae bacterium]
MSIPTKMFALVLRNDGYSNTQEGPSITTLEPYLEAKEIDVPEPSDGQVLIRLIRANINPSDLHFIKGEYGLPRRIGVPAGFEGVGEVAAAGAGGEGLVGKRVAFLASASGAWADYVIADAITCIPVRDDLRDKDAATLFVNPLTAVAMFDEVKKTGTTSFIMTAAASQLCKLITGLAKDSGINAISIVRNDEQIEPLKNLGAAHVLNCMTGDFQLAIDTLMKEEKPRVILDAVADQISADIFFAMPNRAKWVVYGKLSPDAPVMSQMGQFVFTGKEITGFWLTKWMQSKPPKEQLAVIAQVQELFASGKWKTDVRATVSLRDAMSQLPDELSNMNTGKVMLVP